MILLKCKCGCFSSLAEKLVFSPRGMDTGLQSKTFICQNCFNSFTYDPSDDVARFIQQAIIHEMRVQQLPDDTNIKVSFDLNAHQTS